MSVVHSCVARGGRDRSKARRILSSIRIAKTYEGPWRSRTDPVFPISPVTGWHTECWRNMVPGLQQPRFAGREAADAPREDTAVSAPGAVVVVVEWFRTLQSGTPVEG